MTNIPDKNQLSSAREMSAGLWRQHGYDAEWVAASELSNVEAAIMGSKFLKPIFAAVSCGSSLSGMFAEVSEDKKILLLATAVISAGFMFVCRKIAERNLRVLPIHEKVYEDLSR